MSKLKISSVIGCLVGLLTDSRKMHALRSVTFTAATKVIISFKFPFWQRENGFEKKGGKVITDLPIKQIYYPQKSKFIFVFKSDVN